MTTKFNRLLIVCLSCLSIPAWAQVSETQSFNFPPHGILKISMPPEWKGAIHDRGPDAPPALRFEPKAGNGFVVEVTPLWPNKANPSVPALEQIEQIVRQGAEDQKPESIETDIPVQEITDAIGGGYYFKVTDRDLKPGEFKYMTRGMLRAGKVVLAFTALSNDDPDTISNSTLTMVKSAHLVAQNSRKRK